MFCRKCGKQIPDDSAFCPKCGMSVVTDNIENAANEHPAVTLEKTAENTSAVITKRAYIVDSVKKNPKLKIILISVGAVIAVLAIILFAVILPERHSEFYYKRDEDHKYYIILGAKKDMKEINIPDTIWFKPVRVIEDEAFRKCSVESVSFGKNIQHIGINAFRECKTLKTVKFSDEMKYDYDTGNVIIDLMAFRSCSALKSVFLPNINTEIYDETFCGCSKLSEIDLENVSVIRTRAFAACTSLTEIRTNANLSDRAFEECSALYSVSLHDTNIPERCFDGCTSLERVRCSQNSGTIQDDAFNNCSNLSSFYVDGVEYNSSDDLKDNGISTNDEAFSGCDLFGLSMPTTKHNWAAGTELVGLTQGEIKRYFNNDFERVVIMGHCIKFDNGDVLISELNSDRDVVNGLWLYGDHYLSSDLGKTDFVRVGMTVQEVFDILGETEIIERNEMEYSVTIKYTMYGYNFSLSLSGKTLDSKITEAYVSIEY